MKMTRKTDSISRDELCSLISTYWWPTPRSRRIIEKAIWSPPTPPGFNLDLNHDDRLWFKKPITPENDKGYALYCEFVRYYVNRSQPTIDELQNYDVWVSGKFRDRKLFRFLRDHLPTQAIERLTTHRNTTASYLVLSNNPVDLFMCSSGQSFSSCMGLGSTYSGAFYMSLPALLVDPARFIIYQTAGKIVRTPVKDKEIAHFRYINRAFAFWTQNGEIQPIQPYPNPSFNFHAVFKEAGFELNPHPVWESPRLKIPLLKSVCGYTMYPYQDVSSSRMYGTIQYGHVESYGPGGPESLEIQTSFEGMPNNFMKLGYIGRDCECCGKHTRKSNLSSAAVKSANNEVFTAYLCQDCLQTQYYLCRRCGYYHNRFSHPPNEVARPHHTGQPREPKQYCDTCFKIFKETTAIIECKHCNTLTQSNCAPFLSYDHVCFACIPARKRSICIFCEEHHLKKDLTKMAGRGYVCSSCWERAYWCSSCLKPFAHGHAIKGSNKIVCLACAPELYVDRYQYKDPEYQSWSITDELMEELT